MKREVEAFHFGFLGHPQAHAAMEQPGVSTVVNKTSVTEVIVQAVSP